MTETMLVRLSRQDVVNLLDALTALKDQRVKLRQNLARGLAQRNRRAELNDGIEIVDDLLRRLAAVNLEMEQKLIG